MSRIVRVISLATATATAAASPAAEGQADEPPRRRMPLSASFGLSPGVGVIGSKPARMQRQPADARPLTVARRPGTKQRLGRLRRELGRISPAPADPHSARAAIIDAMARAGLANWTVPPLESAATVHHPDGSLELALLTHAIVFNPGGAFRILDLYPPVSVYFEMPDRNGRRFVPPMDRDGAGKSPYCKVRSA